MFTRLKCEIQGYWLSWVYRRKLERILNQVKDMTPNQRKVYFTMSGYTQISATEREEVYRNTTNQVTITFRQKL